MRLCLAHHLVSISLFHFSHEMQATYIPSPCILILSLFGCGKPDMCSQKLICDVCSIETNLRSPTKNDEFRRIRLLACVMKSAEQQNAMLLKRGDHEAQQCKKVKSRTWWKRVGWQVREKKNEIETLYKMVSSFVHPPYHREFPCITFFMCTDERNYRIP
jgi:hypothetical protein